MSKEGHQWHQRRNPHRLYLNREKKLLCGVCAGIADYTGADVKMVRLVSILGLLFFAPVVVVGYLLLCWLIPDNPGAEQLYKNEDEERFWRSVSKAPADTFGNLRQNLRNQEVRLRRLEAYVTSTEFQLYQDLD